MAESEQKQPEVHWYSSHQEAEKADRAYWHSKTPMERLIAAEQLRQLAYGYDPLTARIQEVVEWVPLKT